MRGDDSFFEKLVQRGSDAIISIDEESRVVFANESVERVFGYTPEELEGESLTTVMPERFQKRHQAAVDRYLETGDRGLDWNDIRLPGEHRDGHEVPLSITFERHSHDGDVVFSGIIRDVTEQREYERALETLQDTASELLRARDREAVADRVVDSATDVLDFSHAALYLHDPTDDSFRPVAWSDAVGTSGGGPPVVTGEASLTRRAFESGETVTVTDLTSETPVLDRTAVAGAMLLPLESQGVLFVGSSEEQTFDERATRIANVLATNAVAAMNRADREAALERRNEQLERFASIVSHDLRDPLNTAAAKTTLVRADLGDSDYLDDLDAVHDRMGEIIEDVLTLTREGRAGVETEPVPLAEVVEEAWGTAGTPEATLEVADDLGTVGADRGRLRTLFENLFGNAVRHAGPDPTVRVGALADRRGFYVADDGPGIPEGERESAFEYGYTTDEDGTGLGLNIVAEVAEAHEWAVRLTDGAAGGARFEFEFARAGTGAVPRDGERGS
jgi:PAS domain S-box-containing protein